MSKPRHDSSFSPAQHMPVGALFDPQPTLWRPKQARHQEAQLWQEVWPGAHSNPVCQLLPTAAHQGTQLAEAFSEQRRTSRGSQSRRPPELTPKRFARSGERRAHALAALGSGPHTRRHLKAALCSVLPPSALPAPRSVPEAGVREADQGLGKRRQQKGTQVTSSDIK